MTWPMVSLKRLVDPARPITYGIVQAGPDFPGGVPYIRPVDMTENQGVKAPSSLLRTDPSIAYSYRRSIVQKDDVVVSIGPSFGKVMLVPAGLAGANLTQGTARVAPSSDAYPRFVYWALQAQPARQHWEASVGGATFRALNLEPLSKTPVPFMPLEEQRRIAGFLDVELSRLEMVEKARRRQRDLMAERWTATVAYLVTRGTDDRDHLRKTDSPSFPLVPASWDVLSLKRRWRIIDCKHRTPSYIDDGYPVVSPGDISPGRLDLRTAHRFVDEQDFRDLADDLRRPRRGDIVYSRNASVGIAAYVDTDEPFTMGQDVCRITSVGQSQLYLSYFLNSVATPQLEQMQIGSTFSRVNIGALLDLHVPCPPRQEQDRIAARLDEEHQRFVELQRLLADQIARVAERRQALITAAVTGQIDVTTARGVDV